MVLVQSKQLATAAPDQRDGKGRSFDDHSSLLFRYWKAFVRFIVQNVCLTMSCDNRCNACLPDFGDAEHWSGSLYSRVFYQE